ncbi:MAG: 50S ribosomal protein L23 [Planctomycetota bacterium]
MKDLHTIIKSAVITEKSTDVTDKRNAYTFKVATDSNRIEIKNAIEEIFDVKVKKVNTLRQSGKRKRIGRSLGMTRGYKKAVVTLQPGHKIDVF